MTENIFDLADNVNPAREITPEELEQIKRFQDTFGQEDLHPELQAHLQMGKEFNSLRHPLVFAVPYLDCLNKQLNKSFVFKTKAVFEALSQKDWHSYVYLHERPFRLDAFLTIKDDMPSEKYWELLGNIWTDTEAPHINMKWWKELFNANKPNREYIMSEEDREYYNGLPENVLVYRGFQKKRYQKGISYTLDLNKAKWFGKRFNGDGGVACVRVNKKDIIAFLDNRNEKEVVITKSLKYELLEL